MAMLLASATAANAHSAERGFVLLLPTGNIIAAGAIAVAVSFAALLLVKDSWFKGVFSCEIVLGRLPLPHVRVVSFAAALLFVALIWIGMNGSRDPLENLLTLTVWVLWWVVIVLLHPVIGNLWAWLNPFSWVDAKPRFSFPAYVPALIIFAVFAWFQLVSPSPEDPAVLAKAVAAYLVIGFAGVLLFGTEAWLAKGDPFAIFMRLLAAAAPFYRDDDGIVCLRLPGSGLARLEPLPVAGVLFVLLTLASVSFDGFANTFTWLSWGGINPLDHPGRTALMGHNTLGLVGSFALLSILYALACFGSWQLAGRFVYSLIPISIAFHFAHYLTDLLVNGQYLLVALGLQQSLPTASFLNTASGAFTIYSVQTIAIVAGHVVGVAIGHLIAIELAPESPFRREWPLAVLMVAYTAFGLWTLSAPAIG
jgi:hypothetical protein